MNLDAVSEEVRTALAAITGLRRPPLGVEKIAPPAALVTLPEQIQYDSAYGRGTDRYPDMAVVILVGNGNARAARKQLSAYADGSGPKSVKAALEAYTYTTCEHVTVKTAEFDNARYANVDYQAAIFHLDIVGKGVLP